MIYLLYILGFSVSLFALLVVGETFVHKNPTLGFSKWWRKYVISEEE